MVWSLCVQPRTSSLIFLCLFSLFCLSASSRRQIRSIHFKNYHRERNWGGKAGFGGNGTSIVNYGAPKEAVYSSIPTFSMCLFCFQTPNLVYEKRIASSYNSNGNSGSSRIPGISELQEFQEPQGTIDPFDIDLQGSPPQQEGHPQEVSIGEELPNLFKMIANMKRGRGGGLRKLLQNGSNRFASFLQNTVG